MQNIAAKGRTGGPRDVTVEELRMILSAVRSSKRSLPTQAVPGRTDTRQAGEVVHAADRREYCANADLADWVTVLAGAGLRRSQILGLVWSDIDLAAGTLRTSGKVVRVKAKGLVRIGNDDDPKNRKGVIALARFRRTSADAAPESPGGRQLAAPPSTTDALDLVFPSNAGTLRDPQNVGHEWQRVRDALGIPDDVTAHRVRSAVATISKYGAAWGNRTPDLFITSEALYRLS